MWICTDVEHQDLKVHVLTAIFLIQIEVDQIFALNPTLVVQPKQKPTPSNKRISTTPTNKV